MFLNLLIIDKNSYIYGKLIINKHKLIEYKLNQFKKHKSSTLVIDCYFFNYLIREIEFSNYYRLNFIKTTNKLLNNNEITTVLLSTKYNLIDYNWNDRLCTMVREYCELDHTLSWLSTLGGAFSALGDYYLNCAQVAGQISFKQFQLAKRLNDPLIVIRCRLYFSLSLIQRQQFKLAKKIIRYEYNRVKNSTLITDKRLIRMCKGIWSKLQYEHKLYCIKHKLKTITINNTIGPY